MPIEARACRRLLALTLLPLSASALAASPYRAHLPAAEYRLATPHRPAGRDQVRAPALPAADLAKMPYAREVAAAAHRAGLDAALVHAVIHVESRHRPQAVSRKGARGLMQVLPETAARYGIADPGRSPHINIKAGTLYLRDLMDLFDERLDLVLAAYNAGEGAVVRHAMKVPPYAETRQYVRDVLHLYRIWRPLQDAVPAAAPPLPLPDYLQGTRLTSIANWQ